MAINNTGDFWTLSDSIEDIEDDGIISITEYGQSTFDTIDNSDDLQFGYGRGIPIHAARAELAADTRKYKHNKMGELLTTEDIVQLNMHDADKFDPVPETAAMLRSVGINKYDDSKFTSYRSENNKILSKPIVNGRGYPILLDDEFHKFQIKPKVKAIDSDNTTNGSTEDGTMLNNNNLAIDNQNGESSSNDEASSYIGFAKILSPDPTEKHTLRYRQPTVGIGREIFVKPIEVYFSQKTKQSKKKKSSKEVN